MDDKASIQNKITTPSHPRIVPHPAAHPEATDYEENFAFHTARLLFKSNSKKIAGAIGALYGYFRIAADCSNALCLEAIDKGLKRPGQERFRLLEAGKLMAVARSFEEFFPLVEWTIFNAACTQINSFYQVHAAAVSSRKKGILLLGGPGAGKTVTALELILRGYKYISDEVTLIDVDSLLMHPFPRPLLIKQGAFRHFKDLSQKLKLITFRLGFSGERIRYINPMAITGDAVVHPCRADYIIYLNREETGRTRMEKVGKAAAAAEIIGQSFNFPSDSGLGIDAVARIVAAANCFRLVNKDLKKSAELIDGLLNGEKG